MKFTPEEIKEGEGLRNSFRFLPWGSATETQYEKQLTECAIIAQKMKVESINEILSILMLHDVYNSKTQGIFNNSKRVLQYLESL